MIDYGHFCYAAPPRTGVLWFIRACDASGVKPAEYDNRACVEPPHGNGRFTVTVVRNPYDWLVSYYHAYRGGPTGIPVVDQFAGLARQAGDVGRFVQLVARHKPGSVGGMFDAYRATSVVRLEDMPWALIELLASFGVDAVAAEYLAPCNVYQGLPHRPDKRIRAELLAAEADFCGRYNYL